MQSVSTGSLYQMIPERVAGRSDVHSLTSAAIAAGSAETLRIIVPSTHSPENSSALSPTGFPELSNATMYEYVGSATRKSFPNLAAFSTQLSAFSLLQRLISFSSLGL
jgi:hypothetical protein